MVSMILTHATGVIALAVTVLGLVSQSDKVFRRAAVAAAVLWSLNNLFVGANGAALLWGITSMRQGFAAYLQGKPLHLKHVAFTVFAAIALIATGITWNGPVALFGLSATVLATYAVFYTSGFALRLSMALLSFLWLAHAWYYDAVWQMAANLITLGAAGYGAWKMRPARMPLLRPLGSDTRAPNTAQG